MPASPSNRSSSFRPIPRPRTPGLETYQRQVSETGKVLSIRATDSLGAVYALFDISRDYLKVDPLGYWTGHVPARREVVHVPPTVYTPPTPRVRWRGWFINGEDLLMGWRDTFPIPDDVWERIYRNVA